MSGESNDDFVDDILRRRGQFNIFDIRRRARGVRRAPRPRTGTPAWYGIATASLLIGLAVAWPDIAAGGGQYAIAGKWIVASGIAYFFLVNFAKTLLWAAALSLIAALTSFGWEEVLWFDSGAWPAWRLADILGFLGLSGIIDGSVAAWILGRDAAGGFFILALATGGGGLALRRLFRRRGDQ